MYSQLLRLRLCASRRLGATLIPLWMSFWAVIKFWGRKWSRIRMGPVVAWRSWMKCGSNWERRGYHSTYAFNLFCIGRRRYLINHLGCRNQVHGFWYATLQLESHQRRVLKVNSAVQY